VNNKFAKSRNVADLTGKDIWGYANFAERLGPQWMATSEANREAIANEALKRGLVSEGKGTINIQDNPEFWDWAKNTATVQSAPATSGGSAGTPSGGRPSSGGQRFRLPPEEILPMYQPQPLRPAPPLVKPIPMGYNPREDIAAVNTANTVAPRSLYQLYR